VRGAGIDETPRPEESPRHLVERLAREKAAAAARSGELVLGADTVVALGERILGKPENAEEATRMLSRLSGRAHAVWTGVALVSEAGVRSASCRTEVIFRELSDEEIAAYVASGEPLDRAGAYAIQGGAEPFVDRFVGDYENVVGLPLELTAELLRAEGVETTTPADAVSPRP